MSNTEQIYVKVPESQKLRFPPSSNVIVLSPLTTDYVIQLSPCDVGRIEIRSASGITLGVYNVDSNEYQQVEE